MAALWEDQGADQERREFALPVCLRLREERLELASDSLKRQSAQFCDVSQRKIAHEIGRQARLGLGETIKRSQPLLPRVWPCFRVDHVKEHTGRAHREEPVEARAERCQRHQPSPKPGWASDREVGAAAPPGAYGSCQRCLELRVVRPVCGEESTSKAYETVLLPQDLLASRIDLN
jgi:hypothetical protein